MARRMLHRFSFFSLLLVGTTATLWSAEKPSDEYIKMIVTLIGIRSGVQCAVSEQVRNVSRERFLGDSAFADQLANLDAGA